MTGKKFILNPDRPKPRTIKSQIRGFDASNLASAELILAQPERFGGEAAGLVLWARMAKQRIEKEARERQ